MEKRFFLCVFVVLVNFFMMSGSVFAEKVVRVEDALKAAELAFNKWDKSLKDGFDEGVNRILDITEEEIAKCESQKSPFSEKMKEYFRAMQITLEDVKSSALECDKQDTVARCDGLIQRIIALNEVEDQQLQISESQKKVLRDLGIMEEVVNLDPPMSKEEIAYLTSGPKLGKSVKQTGLPERVNRDCESWWIRRGAVVIDYNNDGLIFFEANDATMQTVVDEIYDFTGARVDIYSGLEQKVINDRFTCESVEDLIVELAGKNYWIEMDGENFLFASIFPETKTTGGGGGGSGGTVTTVHGGQVVTVSKISQGEIDSFRQEQQALRDAKPMPE